MKSSREQATFAQERLMRGTRMVAGLADVRDQPGSRTPRAQQRAENVTKAHAVETRIAAAIRSALAPVVGEQNTEPPTGSAGQNQRAHFERREMEQNTAADLRDRWAAASPAITSPQAPAAGRQ
jgi:hypothetical protein